MKKMTTNSKRKKLSLNKSTVRNLDKEQLGDVIGGNDLPPVKTAFTEC